MDKEFIANLSIDINQDLEKICEQLEKKQYEYYERIQSCSDSNRQQQLENDIQKMDNQIRIIKKQIQEINNSIVLDNGMDETKVNDEKKRKKESTNQLINQTNKDEAVNFSNDMEEVDYWCEKGQNSKAFDLLHKLSNNNNSDAQYRLAQMYLSGIGTKMDLYRAVYWMQKSADNGNENAMIMYSYNMIDIESADIEEIKKVGGYLEKLAKKDNLEVMKRYIHIALTRRDLDMMSKSIYFCDVLIKKFNDSYDKDVYRNIKKEIRAYLRSESYNIDSLGSNVYTEKWRRIAYYVGCALVVLGMIHIYVGIDSSIANSSGIFNIMNKFSKIVMPKNMFWYSWANNKTDCGRYGVMLFTIGYSISAFSYYKTEGYRWIIKTVYWIINLYILSVIGEQAEKILGENNGITNDILIVFLCIWIVRFIFKKAYESV